MTHLKPNKSRRGDFLIPFLTVVFDALAIEFAFLFSYWLRFRSPLLDHLGFTGMEGPPFRGYLFGSLAILAIWLLLFQNRKMYGVRRSVSLSDELFSIVRVVSFGMLIVMSLAFFYRDFSYSRVVFVFLWTSSITFISVGRMLVQLVERYYYRRGRHLRNAVVIGGDALANQVYAKLDRHPSFGFNVVGYFSELPAHEELSIATSVYLGPVATAPLFIKENRIDLAFIALRSKDQSRLFELIGECEGINVEFMMVPDFLDVLTSDVKVAELDGIPFLKIKSNPLTPWGRIAKRTFDIAVSGTLIVVTAPIWLLIVVLIKLDSKGPVFFSQERVGLDGNRFSMHKFRSMSVGSEKFDEHAGLGIRHDPRRTPVGVILRRLSMDELPQLWNVLRGEMSLVGPRPERGRFVEEFQEVVPKYLDRHRVKTGVTGWAQVNGLRGDTSIEERIKYDLYYIENWSLAFDIKILLRTLRAALFSKEAR